MTSEKPIAPAYYMDEYDNLVSAPRELVPMQGVSLTSGLAALENSCLLMDALNTRHECGLSPRELLERCQAMEAALMQIIEMNQQWAQDQWGDRNKAESMACVKTARAALAKHKEV